MGHLLLLFGALLSLPVYAFVLHDRSPSKGNHLGLISSFSKRSEVKTYSNNPAKDNYPTCVFNYNSYGYRDKSRPR